MREDGARRCARRAAARGLTVGAPVRALVLPIGDNHPRPKVPRTPLRQTPRGPRPLDFGQRAERYRAQVGGGRRWTLTPHQQRRANHKGGRANTLRHAMAWGR